MPRKKNRRKRLLWLKLITAAVSIVAATVLACDYAWASAANAQPGTDFLHEEYSSEKPSPYENAPAVMNNRLPGLIIGLTYRLDELPLDPIPGRRQALSHTYDPASRDRHIPVRIAAASVPSPGKTTGITYPEKRTFKAGPGAVDTAIFIIGGWLLGQLRKRKSSVRTPSCR